MVYFVNGSDNVKMKIISSTDNTVTFETDHNSICGWIMDLLDRMPEDGEQIYSPPFKMTIKMEDEQKIDRIRIEIEDQ